MSVASKIALRLKAYNKQIKESKSKITFRKVFGIDKENHLNYSSKLFDLYLENGAIFKVEQEVCKLYRTKFYDKPFLEAFNKLQLLFYLAEYDRRMKIEAKKKAKLLKMEEKAKLKQEKLVKAQKLKEEKLANQKSLKQVTLFDSIVEKNESFSLEERDGVTFIKGTNFVLSKFL